MRAALARLLAAPLAASLILGLAEVAHADDGTAPDLVTGLPGGPTCSWNDIQPIGLGDGDETYTLGIDADLVPTEDIVSVEYSGISGTSAPVVVDTAPFTVAWTPASVDSSLDEVSAQVHLVDGTTLTSVSRCYVVTVGGSYSVATLGHPAVGETLYRVPSDTMILNVDTDGLAPRRISVTENGKTLYTGPEMAYTLNPSALYQWIDTAAATTPGTEHLVVSLTDWSGRTLSKPVDVVTVPAATIADPTVTTSTGAKVAAGGWVLEGSTLRYRTTVAVPATPSWLPGIDSWQTIASGGGADTQIVSGEGAATTTAATACLRTDTKDDCGERVSIDGTARAVSDDGTGRFTLTTVAGSTWGGATRSVTLHVYPASVLGLHGPSSATVTRGRSVKLSVLLRERYGDENPVGGETLAVQFRAATWKTWHTVTTVTSSGSGWKSVSVTPTANGSYRVVHADRPGHAGPSTSPAVAVHVRGTVRITAVTAHPTRRHATTVKVTTSPAESGATVRLERWTGSHWRSVATARTSSSGRARLSAELPRGTVKLRVVRAATARYSTAVSPSRTIHVAP